MEQQQEQPSGTHRSILAVGKLQRASLLSNETCFNWKCHSCSSPKCLSHPSETVLSKLCETSVLSDVTCIVILHKFIRLQKVFMPETQG